MQIAKHEREAKAIRIAAATIDQRKIIGAQRVMAPIPRSSLAGAWRLSRCDSVSSSRCGMVVPVEVYFQWTSALHQKMPFSGVFGVKDSIGVQLGQSAAL